MRAGKAVSMRLRGERKAFVLHNARVFVIATVSYLLVAGCYVVFFAGRAREFWLGASIVGFGWMLHALLSMDGLASRRMGADAERWTSRAFRRSKKDWRVIDAVEFEERDVDHVVFGPCGVWAVETKYTSVPWTDAGGVLTGPFRDPLEQARVGARKIHLLLKTHGLEVPVHPVLAVWGEGTRHLRTSVIDDVPVLVGREEKTWLTELPAAGDPLSSDTVQSIELALESFIRLREDWRGRNA